MAGSIRTFVGEVRAEARRVAWASRGEVVQAVVFVFIMVAIAACFFMCMDWLALHVVTTVIGWGG
jgi:preprotein translocase subunit SecE